MRRFVGFLLSLVMVAGLVLALWPLGQTFYGRWSQRSLAAQWQQKSAAPKKAAIKLAAKSGPVKPRSGAKSTRARVDVDSPALVALGTAPRKRARWPLTRLSIPDIELETFIVQGMDSAALRRGPGHDVNSSLPGVGNCVVAGHRNVYGSYFYRLDELMPGAPIIVENQDGTFTYSVEAVFITPATNLTILKPPAPGAAPLLTLITCTMPHSGNRIVLQASLSTQ